MEININQRTLTYFILFILSCISCTATIEDKIVDYISTNCSFNENDSCYVDLSQIIGEEFDKIFIFGETTTSQDISDITGIQYIGNYVPDSEYRLICIFNDEVKYSEDFTEDQVKFICKKIVTDKGLIYRRVDGTKFLLQRKSKLNDDIVYSLSPL